MPELQVRVATVDDAAAVEGVRIATWRVAYRGLLPDDLLDGLTVDVARRAEILAEGSTTTLLALDGDEPVGMAAYGPCRDEDRPDGIELYALYVLPTVWRSGAGTALLASCDRVTSLWVLDGNTRAQAFYARHGFGPDGTTKARDVGTPAREIRMLLG